MLLGSVVLVGVTLTVKAAMPPTATIIPAPREMSVTGGEYWARKPPTVVKVPAIPPEGYELSITTNGITIRHSDEAGAYYAKMTLFHMGRGDAKEKCKVYPCVEIKDAPKFAWRGLHLDDARHFFGKEVVKRTLEQMSWFKLNVFHWHLTDDQSWTLDIPDYPELVKYGDEWITRNGQKPRSFGEKVGPFHYTANDVKEIVAYAKARHITVVPEIEFPGHFLCALCAYPEFACQPEEILKRGRQPLSQGVLNQVMCAGNPDAVRFVERVLDHVCELFPSEVIHIGGDECPRKRWTTCPKCQVLVQREGLKGVEEIQPWLTRHFVAYLAKKGRRAIGWDEIFVDKDCPYSAIRIYVKNRQWTWPLDPPPNATDEQMLEKLRASPYCRCVFACDNDQPEQYAAALRFENGVSVAFSYEALSPVGQRRTRVIGTKGMLEGGGIGFRFTELATGKYWDWNMKIQDVPGYEQAGHGGGDLRLMRDFLVAVDTKDPSALTSSLEASIESHLIGFACEESRLTGRKVQVRI